MANIQYIDTNTAIGDSINIINSNFVELANTISIAEEKSSIFVKGYSNYFTGILQTFQEAAKDINDKKNKWLEAATLISANSAKWLQPISLLYPCIYDGPETFVTEQFKLDINDWLGANFPIVNNDGTVNYPENQKIILFVTFRTKILEEKFTDNTIYDSVQAIEYTAKNSTWETTEYLTGSKSVYGITPTPTRSVTPTITPTPSTTTAFPAAFNTPTPSNTPLVTPTPTYVSSFTMSVINYAPDTGSGGYIKAVFNCFLGGYYVIKVGKFVYYAENNVPVYIDNLKIGTYLIEIINVNTKLKLSSKITGTLNITDNVATTGIIQNYNTVQLNTLIYST